MFGDVCWGLLILGSFHVSCGWGCVPETHSQESPRKGLGFRGVWSRIVRIQGT